MKKPAWLVLMCTVLCAAGAMVARPQPSSSGRQVRSAPAEAGPSKDEIPQRKITAYTLPPDGYKKSQDLARIYLRFHLVSFAYSLLVLWFILRSKWAVKYRDAAEGVFKNRFMQAVIFAPLLFVTVDILEMPFGIYSNWVLRKYGISVQGVRWLPRSLASRCCTCCFS